jgi:hypothetical protein
VPCRDIAARGGSLTAICGCRNERSRHDGHFGHCFLHMVTEAEQARLLQTGAMIHLEYFITAPSMDRERYRQVDALPFCADPPGDGATGQLRVRSDGMAEELSLSGVREISGAQRKSGYQKRSRAAVTPQGVPRCPTLEDSDDEDLMPSGGAIARIARHVSDSSAPNQLHRRSNASRYNRGPSDRSSAVERCVHDRSGPKRMRRTDVDLWQSQ